MRPTSDSGKHQGESGVVKMSADLDDVLAGGRVDVGHWRDVQDEVLDLESQQFFLLPYTSSPLDGMARN